MDATRAATEEEKPCHIKHKYKRTLFETKPCKREYITVLERKSTIYQRVYRQYFNIMINKDDFKEKR